MRLILGSGLTRLGLSPISGLASLTAAGFTIRAAGEDAFGALSVFSGFIAMFPFLDLGLGAAVVDTISHDGVTAQSLSVVRRAHRLLVIVAFCVALVGVALAASGSWSVFVGESAGSVGNVDLTGLLFAFAFALSIPLSLGGRILFAIGRQPVALLAAAVGSVVSASVTVTLWAIGTRAEVFVVAVPLGLAVGSWLSWHAGMSHFSGRAGTDAVHEKDDRDGGPLSAVAVPMLIVMICAPLAMHSDRLILSHLGDISALSSYSLIYQLFIPIYGVITAGLGTLWPTFNRLRFASMPLMPLWRKAMLLGLAGAVVASAAVAVSVRPTAALLSDGTVEIPTGMIIATAALILVQALHYPSAMAMMQATSLRVQALLSALMVATNIPLSVWMANEFGGWGPLAASALAILVVQALPTATIAIRQLRAEDAANLGDRVMAQSL